MTLVRFDMTHELDDLRREVNRVFTSMPMLAPGSLLLGSGLGHWVPEMDTMQESGQLSITLDLPGLTEADIDVQVEDNVLTIHGKREIKREKKGQQWHRYERSSGEFSRSLQLPDSIDADKVKAEFDKGVLTVTVPVPKQVETGARHVAITSGAKG